MKGLIFSEVTIEEQIVWPKADSGPQKTRKKMVWRVQQQENIYRITLHFLVRKNETAECHWKRRDKGRGLAEKQTQERSKPLTIALKKKKKKSGCLLLLLKVWLLCGQVRAPVSCQLPLFLLVWEEQQTPTWPVHQHRKPWALQGGAMSVAPLYRRHIGTEIMNSYKDSPILKGKWKGTKAH